MGVLGATVASAAPLCTNDTYANYETLGANGCQFGNAIFSNFSFSYASSDSTNKNASTVSVTPEFQPVADANHPGLQFGTANLIPAAGFFEDYTFTFTVTAAPGFKIDDAFLKIAGDVFVGSGAGTVTETITPAGDPQTSLHAFFTESLTNNKTSSTTFNPTNSVTVTKDIRLTNTSAPNGLIDLSSVSNDFSLVDPPAAPEPASALALGIGLCALGLGFRKRANKG